MRLSIYGSTALPDLGRFFSSVILYTGDQTVPMPLRTSRTRQTQNKLTQTFTLRVGFEPTIPVFERAKMVHASAGEVTVISKYIR
jgi:hypothetical protein